MVAVQVGRRARLIVAQPKTDAMLTSVCGALTFDYISHQALWISC